MKYHNENIIHFKWVELLVNDLNKSLFFYEKILGLNIIEQKEESVLLGANKKDVLIKLIINKDASRKKVSQGLYHFALLLPSEEALANLLNHLLLNDYPLSGLSDHGVSQAIYLEDPNGNGIELYCDRDDTKWPKENNQLTMYTKPLNYAKLLSNKSSNQFTKIDKETILGHLHLHVLNLNKSKDFFTKTIGLKLILDYYGSALFLSDGNYHHHLGINTWAKNAPYRAENEVGLIGYYLHVPNSAKEEFISRLSHNNIEILVDKDNKNYIYDTEKQKIYF